MAIKPAEQAISGIFQSSRDTVENNSTATVAITNKRALATALETPAGDSAMDEANDALRVNLVAGAGSGGTAMVDDAAFTVGGTSFTPVGGTFRSALDSVDDGDGGAFAMTQTRSLFVNVRDDAGDSVMDGANNAVRVNIVAGAGSGGTAMTDEAAFTEGGTSFTPVGGVLNDTITSDPTEDQAATFRITAKRGLHVNLRDVGGIELGTTAAPVGVRIGDGTNTATIRDLASNDALNVAIVDGAGAQITSFGGGVQYTQGDVDASITGTAAMMEVAGDTLQPVQGTVADGLLVNLGANNDVTVTSGTVTANAGTGFPPVVTDGAAAGTTGIHVLGTDGTNAQILSTNATGHVNIADGGNVITVDGTVNIGTFPDNEPFNVAQINGVTPLMGNGVTGTGSQRVTIASDNTAFTVNIGTFPDNEPFNLNQVGGSAVLTGGTAGSQGVGGLAAHASPSSGNPVYVGGRASTSLPTDVGADGDVAAFWTNRNGATVVAVSPHIGLNSDPYNLIHEAAQYTTTQTSTVLIAGGASEKIVVTKVQIQVGGTTAGTLQLYFGTGAFSRGTSRAIFDGEFAPSATLKPGVVMDGPFISGTNGDDLLVTTSAAINPLTINVWYYVVV